MAKATAADLLVDRLRDWGVQVVFGLPGDGINGIMEALRQRKAAIRFVQVRHEESAAFMACAYAKFTGQLGVCLAASGPGGLHLLNGLYDAKLDGQPVLAITGLQYHELIGTYSQQDVEFDKVFMDVAKFNERIMGPAHVENVVDLACRTALSCRGVAHITFPVDLQSSPAERKGSKHNIPFHSWKGSAISARLPAGDDMERAADILNAGKKVVILAGRGALHATDELLRTAEQLGAPLATALLGKGAIPDDSPPCGRHRRPARHEALAGGAEQVRHAAHRRQLFPLRRVLPEAGRGARRADRARSGAAGVALSDRGGSGRRQPRHA